MLRAVCNGMVLLSVLLPAAAVELEFPHCSCEGDYSFWSIDNILQCQKVSDFLIAAAYFSIPLELVYFASCSHLFPFKWVVIQFGAFIVLCGLTHLLSVFTYEPHTFFLMLCVTISKFFTALVSFATAITLLTLIPQLLRLKVRENFLRLKARELGREVGMMKRQEEASWHVRMLTQEIRKSLDRHTILYTTMDKLSNTLGLQNCAVWMPNKEKKEMNLTHELRQRNSLGLYGNSIPIDDLDVRVIKQSEGIKILQPESLLARASSGGELEPGPVAAIRMPMLKVSHFKGGTPELVPTCYAILVLVLPRDDSRVWSKQELEIIEVVADQVAVALSHAAILEESQLMRDKLAEQNRALLQAKQNVLLASEARNSFQMAMSQGMRRPIHSVMGLLSMIQQDKLGYEQRVIVNAMAKTTSVVSTLVNDVMETSTVNNERLTLEMRPFKLHSLIKEAISVARCLCDSKGFGFGFQVDSTVPDLVLGDDKRIFHVILHMVGTLLMESDQAFLTFHILSGSVADEKNEQGWFPWKSNLSEGYTCVKFEVGLKRSETGSSSSMIHPARKHNSQGFQASLSFRMCKKLVQMMQGKIWVGFDSDGLVEKITLVLQFQMQPITPFAEMGGSFERHRTPTPSFKGLRVLLADDDDVNRAVTRKLLERLGFHVTSVSSGIQCLSSLGTFRTPFQLVILDVHMPNMDGFEVAMKIRMLRSGSWPLMVAMTATDEEDVWQRCSQSGFNGLIRKPVTLQAMGNELYRVLQNM